MLRVRYVVVASQRGQIERWLEEIVYCLGLEEKS